MQFMDKAVFFAGVMTKSGYQSHLDETYKAGADWRAYLIKGGAGMGKSSLMKGVAAELEDMGQSCEYIMCPSDPDSLDAVVFPDIKACICDATAPHIINPKYPEVCEVLLNHADHCDREKLALNKAEIVRLTDANSATYQRVYRYIGAVSALLNDSYKIAYDCCDARKASVFGAEMAARLLREKHCIGSETVRFLSAITPKGLVHFTDTLGNTCERVIAVEDEYGAVSRLILSSVRMMALERGYDIITCMSLFAPDDKIEHIIVPELKLAFTTRNRWLKADVTDRIIHARRFCNVSQLHQKRQRLSFNRRAASELITAAVDTLKQAKSIHDDLEKLYVECMDFAALNSRKEQVISELKQRIKQ